MKVILVETRNLASVFPALDAGQEPCGDAVPTNRRTFYQQEYNHNCHISHMYGSPLDLRFFLKHKVNKISSATAFLEAVVVQPHFLETRETSKESFGKCTELVVVQPHFLET